MEIRHIPEELRFSAVGEDGFPMGELRYTLEGDGTIVATHTLVPPRFGGKGIAGLLTDALVQYAREQHKGIKPLCSYIVRRFEQSPEEYKDVAR